MKAFIFATLVGVPMLTAHPLDGFKATKLGGKEVEISKEYAGKVLVIANTASLCGYTPQLASLQQINSDYSAKGVQVLGFPSDDFNQEHKSEKEIAEVCDVKYRAKFPVFRPVSVKGSNIHPVFKYLTENAKKDAGEVRWNFEKFIVAKDGKVIARFRSGTDPLDKEFKAALETALKS
jgi:glutathione peroxidase